MLRKTLLSIDFISLETSVIPFKMNNKSSQNHGAFQSNTKPFQVIPFEFHSIPSLSPTSFCGMFHLSLRSQNFPLRTFNIVQL
eukprot:UN10280